MNKTILIPIDFSIESLNTLRCTLENNKTNKLNIVLFYAEYQDTSITQLLFYSSHQRIAKLSTQEFNDMLGIIKNMYETTILSLRIEIFNGINKNAFINFYEANKIDQIILPKYWVLKPKKNGFDPTPIILSSKLEFTEIGWDYSNNILNELFHVFQ